jgi:hypothetical protein
MPKRPNWIKKRKVNTWIILNTNLFILAAEAKQLADEKIKQEQEKKSKYLDNFKSNLLDLAAADQAKKLAAEKAKQEQDKKGLFTFK